MPAAGSSGEMAASTHVVYAAKKWNLEPVKVPLCHRYLRNSDLTAFTTAAREGRVTVGEREREREGWMLTTGWGFFSPLLQNRLVNTHLSESGMLTPGAGVLSEAIDSLWFRHGHWRQCALCRSPPRATTPLFHFKGAAVASVGSCPRPGRGTLSLSLCCGISL